MSYALRHNPGKYGIELDAEGYTDLDGFLAAMNGVHHFRPRLTREDLQFVIDHSDKKRFELTDTKIRALYGHSLARTIQKQPVVPPDVLYHGTAHRFLDSIMADGLLPMRRQYVHLSADRETALQVGRRRDAHPVLIRVDAKAAAAAGISFFAGNDKVWLSEPIPPAYLKTRE